MAKILVIDDDPDLRSIVRDMLGLLGHSVVEAEDGRAGVESVEADPPDLVICDIVMQGQEGVETILQLRRGFPMLPILAMSGNNPFYITLAQSLGAGAGLRKPFGIEGLRRAVDDLLPRLPCGCCRRA